MNVAWLQIIPVAAVAFAGWRSWLAFRQEDQRVSRPFKKEDSSCAK